MYSYTALAMLREDECLRYVLRYSRRLIHEACIMRL